MTIENQADWEIASQWAESINALMTNGYPIIAFAGELCGDGKLTIDAEHRRICLSWKNRRVVVYDASKEYADINAYLRKLTARINLMKRVDLDYAKLVRVTVRSSDPPTTGKVQRRRRPMYIHLQHASR